MELVNSYYFWLMPQKETYDKFQKIIHDLGQTYDTPTFEPHVTLVSGLNKNETHLIEKINAFVQGKHSLSVVPEGIDYAQGMLTALYLKIHNTPAIDQLNAQAREDLQPLDQDPYHPHLSLLYGDIMDYEKKRIVTELNLSFKTITLDKLKLVKGHSDVTQWCVIKEWPLNE